MRLAAARAARGLLPLAQGTTVLDRLTSLAIDRTQPGELRALAIEALATLPARTVRPVLDELKDDASPAVRAALVRQGAVTDDPVADLEEASDGWLPRDPQALLQLVARAAGDRAAVDAASSDRAGAVEGRRRQEEPAQGLARGARRAAPGAGAPWQPRGAVRPAGIDRARGGAAARRLPRGARADRRCLMLSSRWPPRSCNRRRCRMPKAWRRGVADTFQAIVAREGITARHAAMRRVKSRFREHVELLVRNRPQIRT